VEREVRVYVEALELTYSNHGVSCHNRLTIILDVTGYDVIGVHKALSYASSLMRGGSHSLLVWYCNREPDGSCYTIAW
jgi:hypothetical protein